MKSHESNVENVDGWSGWFNLLEGHEEKVEIEEELERGVDGDGECVWEVGEGLQLARVLRVPVVELGDAVDRFLGVVYQVLEVAVEQMQNGKRHYQNSQQEYLDQDILILKKRITNYVFNQTSLSVK